MIKSIDAALVPNQYEIHKSAGSRFIFAQPTGEKIMVHEKPSMVKIAAVAVAAGASLVGGWAYWVANIPR